MSREPPPAALDDRLDALAARVRRQRVRSGISLAVLFAALFALLIAFLDAQVDLSSGVRTGAFLAWLLIAIATAWRWAVRPWIADPPVEEVAERMMLDDSPNVVAAIAREEKEHRLYPARPGVALAFLAGIASAVALGWASGSSERMRRIALPWHTRSIVAPFEIVVVSGDAVARRGEPITLSAYLKPREPGMRLPQAATLRTRGGEVPMEGVNGAFHVTLPAAEADFDYRVEVGSEASDWFTVVIADPVELAPESSISLAPPAYLAEHVKPAMAPFTDLETVQYSTASLQMRFTRAAESAAIEWRPDGRNPFEAPDVIPVTLAPDRRSGSATLPLRANGMLRAVLVNESGPRRMRTETAVGVRVRMDQPPRFERLEGMAAQPRTARPGQQLHIRFTASDDFGIATATLESETGAAPILLERTGATRADGLAVIVVPDREGEAVRFRLRVRDTRRIASEALAAQEVVFPPAGWFEVKASSAGPPFQEQQIAGQRDSVHAAIVAAKARFETWAAELEAIQGESRALETPPLDHNFRLANVRDQVRETRVSLERGASEARLAPELAPLASRITAFADGPLQDVDGAIDQACESGSRARLRLLTSGVKVVERARASLDELAGFNDRIARFRLDRVRLLALAHDLEALANTSVSREELAKRESARHAELKGIIADSEPLSRGTAALAAGESARRAIDARRLFGRVRELDAAAIELHRSLRKELLAEHAAAQAEVATSVAGFAKQWDAPARLAALASMKQDDFERVVALLRQDKLVDALTELERLAAAMEKLAAECDALAADRTDARLAASQYAKWQADLRTRFLADPTTAPVAEQRALVAASERLVVPTGGEAPALRDAAITHARLALRRLELGNADTQIAMRLAAETFERLAQKTPTLTERHTRARSELDKLRLEQDSIIGSAELAIRQFDRLALTPAVMQNIAVKLGPLQTRQARLADRATTLDLPRHEARQIRIVQAAKAAAADLKDGLPLDCVASLGACRRELDRLKQALENQSPADARIEILAAKQAEVLRLVLAAGEDAPAKSWEPVVALQREVANGAGHAELVAPEAPGLLADVRRAAELAELSLRDGSDFDTIVRRLRDAKEATALLADRLHDRESEKDRVLRLAAMRRTAECGAKKLAGRMANPDASAAAKADLNVELTELAMTRVGSAAQAAKRKTVEAYIRLMNKAEPDRQAADQKQLAESLTEVAGLMANEARLATRPDTVSPSSDAAGDHLPSAKHASALRELAKRERDLRERLSGVGARLADKLKPAAESPFARLEARQRAFAESLLPPKDGSVWRRGLFARAAESAHRAADRLAVGDRDSSMAALDDTIRAVKSLGTKEPSAVREELAKAAPSSNAVAAQLRSRHAALADQAKDLAMQFRNASEAGDPSIRESGDRLRKAGESLAEAARKAEPDAARLRAESLALLETIPLPREDPGDRLADPASRAVHEAEREIQRALRETDPKPAVEAIRRAAAELRRAAEAPLRP